MEKKINKSDIEIIEEQDKLGRDETFEARIRGSLSPYDTLIPCTKPINWCCTILIRKLYFFPHKYCFIS